VQNFNFPIVIFSSSRNNYFINVLDSLLSQSIGFDNNKVFLFSDSNGCRDSILNIEYFSKKFNISQIKLNCTESKGIANSRWIAENFVFRELNAEWALFLEDDLILSPNYLKSLIDVYNYLNSKNLLVKTAKFASYGNLDNDEFYYLSKALITLKHNWGTLESRKQWEICFPLLNFYTCLVNKFGYNQRIHSVILEVYNLLGFSWNFNNEIASMTSQDNFRTALNIISGNLRLNTSYCLAHYIGESGTNFNKEDYILKGFNINKIYSESYSEYFMDDTFNTSNFNHSILSSQKYLYSNSINISNDNNNQDYYIDSKFFNDSFDEYLKLSYANALAINDFVVIDSTFDSLFSIIFSLETFLKVSDYVLLKCIEFPGRLIIFVSNNFPKDIFLSIINSSLDIYLFIDKTSDLFPLAPTIENYQPEALWHQLNFYSENGFEVLVFNPSKHKLCA